MQSVPHTDKDSFHQKDKSVNVLKEIIDSQIHMKHINTLCRQIAENAIFYCLSRMYMQVTQGFQRLAIIFSFH
jgi:hypothetical protein